MCLSPAPAVLLACAVLAGPARAADPAPTDPEAVAFFERKIRPVLAEHCLTCHSAAAEKTKKLKAGLFLDTRAGVLAGGDSGPSVVPGKAADSPLVQTMRYDGDLHMPPKGKLPDAVIADFEKWVNDGAVDPRGGELARRQVGMSVADGRQFWAYLPVQSPAVPVVKAADWPRDAIDRFVLAKLEMAELKPSPDADRATLARRLYFDLTGLPPTPEAVEAFVRDADPRAVEKLVDRLLASPEFGERWGRHWLDVARYAESVTLRGLVFKEAWRYRDYVIDAFNNDVPFDRFIREQIAGDLLPAADLPTRRRQLVATSFLALGNTNLEEQDKNQLRMDVVDEQLDVISKGFLAQTVTCARCHDHKFDPIPTKDYYALAGILRNARAMDHANVSQWVERPLPTDPAAEAAARKHDAAVAAVQARLKAAKAALAAKPGARAGGVLAVRDVPGVVVDDDAAKAVGDWMMSRHSGKYIGTGYRHDQAAGKGEKTLTFQPAALPPGRYDVRLAYDPGDSRSAAVPVTVHSADGEKTILVDMTRPPPIDGRFVSLGEHRFEKDGICTVLVSNEGTTGHVTVDAVAFVPLDRADAGAAAPKAAPAADSAVRALEAELKKLQAAGPKRERFMTVVDEAKIEDARVHIRGLVGNLGETAPRGFLQVATAGPTPAIPPKQSGRRELADWIASPANPLTARVAVNRAWHWLFGTGLVRTPDNFGTTGDKPTHPELLDHLATRFVADGWSMKKLVRAIVLSRTYQQASGGPSGADPENRLYGRANRRRLDAEAIRDSLLSVSGQLRPDRGGPGFPASLAADYGYKADPPRRSVYLAMFRNAIPEALAAFDAADPSTVTGARTASTVAPQALFLMNHPFPADQARHAAAKLLAESHVDDAARVTRLYRLTLGREPTAGERRVAAKYLEGREPESAWAGLFQALFASADFRYVN